MEQVKIGWSKREFSTNEPVLIPGQMYQRLSKGILDPLYATALVVDGGEGQDAVIFCSMDIVIPYNFINDIPDRVKELCPDCPVENIICNATHTHSSVTPVETPEKTVDGQPVYDGMKTRAFIIEQASQAIAEAWRTRTAGQIGYGYGFAVVAHSRRTTYLVDVSKRPRKSKMPPVAPNGHAVMYGNTIDPDFAGYEAGADHFLNAMFTFDDHEKLTGIIINVPCPSQLSEHFLMLSADYWSNVREEVAKEFGPDVFVLPQCAAAGDLSPRILHYLPAQRRRMMLKYGVDTSINHDHPIAYDYEKAMAERRDIAERILVSVKEIYSWAKKDLYKEVPVGHKLETLQLERRKITEEEAEDCRENIKKMEALIPDRDSVTAEEYRVAMSNYNSIKNRNTAALERKKDVEEHPTLAMRMHVARIGDCGFVTERFELYQDFMHRIQARSPFLQTFVLELAGENGCNYLATKRAAENKGYSASLFCNMVSADGGQQIVENGLRILNELKDRE